MEEQKTDISIYDLNDRERYQFIAEVENPLSQETVGINDWKRERLLLRNTKVLIGKEWLILDDGNTIRVDLGKKLKNLHLEEYDILSFEGKVRHVPVDDYYDYDDRCKVKEKWGAQLSPRGNIYYGYGPEYYARTLGFLTNIEKF